MFRSISSPRVRVVSDDFGPSLAQQAFKDEVDINSILKKYKITGRMPVSVNLPSYGDFSGVSDYRSAAEAMRRASNAFMELPAEVRKRFSNDPQEFLDFSSNPDNVGELRKMGLAVPVKEAPAQPPVVEAP